MVSKTTRVVREKKVPVRASGSVGVRKKEIVNATKKRQRKAPVQNAIKKKKILKIRDVEKETKIKILIKNGIVGKKLEQSLAEPAPRKLAIRSPYLFPMPREHVVSAIARYTGVFFVAIGSLFSLLNLYTINPNETVTNLASVSTLEQNTTDNLEIDHTPKPVISIEGSGDVLREYVHVVVTVPYAEHVYLVAFDRDSGQDFALGYAERIDDTTWKYNWLTTNISDSEYKIKVVIQNQFGSYSDIQDTTYIVNNNESNSSGGSTTDGDVVANSSTQEPVAVINEDAEKQGEVLLTIRESSPVSDTVPIEITVVDASSVTVQAKNARTGALYFVGSAEKRDEMLWKRVWDSNSVPDGTYVLTAKAITTRGNLLSEDEEIIVENGLVDEATTTGDVFSDQEEPVLKPEISISFSKRNPISGFVEVDVNVVGAQWVEMYALQKNSLAPFFLGLAKKISEQEWKYLWQTTNSPNGEYALYVRIKNQFGFIEGEKHFVSISNTAIDTFTTEQEQTIETLQRVADTLIKATDEVIAEDQADVHDGVDTAQQNLVYIKPTEMFVDEVEADDEVKDEVRTLLNEYRTQLEFKLNELARAKRADDEVKMELLKEEIEQLRKDVFQNLPTSLGKAEILEQIHAYLSQITYELQEMTVKNEVTLQERVGDAIYADSDNDDVTDYDEINLYQTNPFTADTDGDGYTDGVEIGMGYNPHASEGQTLIAYESAQEVGITREDILVIASIANLAPSTEEQTTNRALITGKGLPNSFVTLFIYSTPLIVTVKTDADGSWSYILDKEMEEGEHEIYAGITDNAGRIVAKSSPLPFVKTAEAYTGKTERQQETIISQTEPSLVEGNVMLLVASTAVSALGLVLILLGLHITGGRREEMQPALQ